MDPVTASQSIFWMSNKASEAEREHRTTEVHLHRANERLRIARGNISRLQTKRKELNARLDVAERHLEISEQNTLQKLRVATAQDTMLRESEEATSRFAQKIINVEYDLNRAKDKLTSWRQKLRQLADRYTQRKQQMNEVMVRQRDSNSRMADLESKLYAMKKRTQLLERKREERKLQNQLLVTEDSTREMEVRAQLAEQQVESLLLYRQTLLEEYDQQRVTTLDLVDKHNLVKQQKKGLMKKYNVSHPIQYLH